MYVTTYNNSKQGTYNGSAPRSGFLNNTVSTIEASKYIDIYKLLNDRKWIISKRDFCNVVEFWRQHANPLLNIILKDLVWVERLFLL